MHIGRVARHGTVDAPGRGHNNGPTHGKESTYSKGCRCDECREAARIGAARRRDERPGYYQERQRQYYKKHRLARLETLFRAKYGIDFAERDRLLALQDHRCAICRVGDVPLEMDHCHTKGNHREFLCGSCNRGIGIMGEDAARLRAAADYIEKWNN